MASNSDPTHTYMCLYNLYVRKTYIKCLHVIHDGNCKHYGYLVTLKWLHYLLNIYILHYNKCCHIIVNTELDTGSSEVDNLSKLKCI